MGDNFRSCTGKQNTDSLVEESPPPEGFWYGRILMDDCPAASQDGEQTALNDFKCVSSVWLLHPTRAGQFSRHSLVSSATFAVEQRPKFAYAPRRPAC